VPHVTNSIVWEKLKFIFRYCEVRVQKKSEVLIDLSNDIFILSNDLSSKVIDEIFKR
jgi:hypothetical protein